MDWAETSASLSRACAEVPVSFPGPAGRLEGIFTPPAPQVTLPGRCVIFPARPRFAFRRLTVLAARILAASGFAVLRFDLRGSGESGGATEVENRHHPHGDDVSAAMSYLHDTQRMRSFTLIGYCFDGLCVLDAVSLASDAIEGVMCVAAPVTEDAIAAAPMQRLARSVRSPGSVLSRLKDPRRAAEMIRTGGRILSALAERQNEPQVAPNFARGLRALEASRARALFLYGEPDPLRRELEVAERELFAHLSAEARARLRIEIWPGAVHSIESEPAVFERAITWVREIER